MEMEKISILLVKDNIAYNIYYCSKCRKTMFNLPLCSTANALCYYRKCDYCETQAVVDPLAVDDPFIPIPLDSEGVSVDRYIEREGV